MSSFALELSQRFTSNDKYWTLLVGLQSAGVAKTLAKAPETEDVSADDCCRRPKTDSLKGLVPIQN